MSFNLKLLWFNIRRYEAYIKIVQKKFEEKTYTLSKKR